MKEQTNNNTKGQTKTTEEILKTWDASAKVPEIIGNDKQIPPEVWEKIRKTWDITKAPKWEEQSN